MKCSDYKIAEGVSITIMFGAWSGPYKKLCVSEVYYAPIDRADEHEFGNNGYIDKIPTDFIFKRNNKNRRVYESRVSFPATRFCTIDGYTHLVKLKCSDKSMELYNED